jgi:hypothetical protein
MACDRKEGAIRILACDRETHPTWASARERTSMSFLRHEEIYRSDVGTRRDREQRTLSLLPALIGFDEFPVGYSLAGCPPAEPASASPTRNYSPQPTLPYNYFFCRVCSVTFLNEATRSLKPLMGDNQTSGPVHWVEWSKHCGKQGRKHLRCSQTIRDGSISSSVRLLQENDPVLFQQCPTMLSHSSSSGSRQTGIACATIPVFRVSLIAVLAMQVGVHTRTIGAFVPWTEPIKRQVCQFQTVST